MIRVLDSLCLQLHPALHLLRWEWRGPMSLPRFQVAFNQLLEYSIEYKTRRWLVDAAVMPPVGSSEQAWLSEEWLPQVAQQGLALANLALVLPTSLHNHLVVESVLNDGRRYLTTNVQFFSDTTSALDWLTPSPSVLFALEDEWRMAHTVGIQAGRLVA